MRSNSPPAAFRILSPASAARRRLRAGLLVAVLAQGAGCVSLNDRAHGLGAQFADGAARAGMGYLDSEPGRVRLRSVTDSSAASLAAAYEGRISPAVARELLRLRLASGEFVGATRDSVAAAIRGPLSASVAMLLRHNAEQAGEEARAQLRLTSATVASEMQTQLVPVMVGAVGAAVDTAVHRTARSEARLRPLADSVVASAVRRIFEEARDQGRGFRRDLAAGGAALLFAVLGVALWWNWYDRRRRGEALAAVAAAVNRHVESSGGAIKREIKEQARSREVEGYLLAFLEQNGFRPRPSQGGPRPTPPSGR